ncbi:MAG: radical SAM family heme chaperone HemW, partial [Clostridium sp.]
HIPFCAKKCLYCDFNSFSNRKLEDEYIESLIKEIRLITDTEFETIFIGGGTPTILSIHNLKLLLNSLDKFSPKEFTVECNPGTLTKENLTLMKSKGVNRLSIGLQSTHDRILKSLGRIHTYKEFLDGYNMSREVGFQNINIDLMFAVPGQGLEEFKESLQEVSKLNPEHISAYSLIVEEGTPFYEMKLKGELFVVDEDVEREMYDYLIEFLESKEYKWYEISNFAKDNLESLHNKAYWNGREYIGVGAGAHSYSNNRRYSNVKEIEQYIESINNGDGKNIEQEEYINKRAAMEEFMFLGLRMIDGISKKEFLKRFSVCIESVYEDQLRRLQGLNLLSVEGDQIKLTRKGVNFSNSVFIEFIN